jgi:glutathione S-transferase
MAVQSKIIEVLPADYGYVVFTAVGSVFVNMWMMINVVKARKEHNVKYPALYSPDNNKFNCIQRVHQNTLESYPTFLLLLLFGGLQYPRISAGAGVVYLVGRIAYAIGYYTGDPEKRKWGMFGGIGSLCLLGNTISFAAHQLKLVGK